MTTAAAERPGTYRVIDVRAYDHKKDGTPLLTKAGKPMWATSIKIASRPDLWVTGLAFADPSGWKDTEQELILYVEEYEGKPQPKFKLPPRKGGGAGLANEKLDRIIALLQSIDAKLHGPSADR